LLEIIDYSESDCFLVFVDHSKQRIVDDVVLAKENWVIVYTSFKDLSVDFWEHDWERVVIYKEICILEHAFLRINDVSILLRSFKVVNCNFRFIFNTISKILLNEKVDFTLSSLCFIVDFNFERTQNFSKSARVTMEKAFRKIIEIMLMKTWSKEFNFIAFCLFKKELAVIWLEKHHFSLSSTWIPWLWIHNALNEINLFSNVEFSQCFKFLWEILCNFIINIVKFH